MRGSVFKRCHCRDPKTRKSLHRRCPKLKRSDHGAWWYRYDAPRTADGKRRQPIVGPFDTKEKAEEELSIELARIGVGGNAPDRSLLTGAYLDYWLKGKKYELKPKTYKSYEEAVRLYFKPAFGHRPLVGLRDDHIQDLVEEIQKINRPLDGKQPSELLRRLIDARADDERRVLPPGERRHKKSTKPLSPARIVRIIAVLKAALNDAVPHKIPYNQAADVKLPRVPRRRRPILWTAERVTRWEKTGKIPGKVMVWTPAQTGAFLDFADASGDRLYPLYHLVAYRGPRRGEIAGLPWMETDLDQGSIDIWENRPDDDDDPDDPKSAAGERTISLDAGTVEVLRAWRVQQNKERLAAGELWIDSGLVFTREDGTPLRPEAISRRFAALIERYTTIRQRHAEGWSIDKIARRYRTTHEAVRTAIESGPLPPIRFHDLRHGAATLSRAAGVDRKIVSQTLGHSRVSFTDDVYGVVIPEMAKEAAEATATVVPRNRRSS